MQPYTRLHACLAASSSATAAAHRPRLTLRCTCPPRYQPVERVGDPAPGTHMPTPEEAAAGKTAAAAAAAAMANIAAGAPTAAAIVRSGKPAPRAAGSGRMHAFDSPFVTLSAPSYSIPSSGARKSGTGGRSALAAAAAAAVSQRDVRLPSQLDLPTQGSFAAGPLTQVGCAGTAVMSVLAAAGRADCCTGYVR
jgi:hypothetical protein